MQLILSLWSVRDLKLLGKITGLKTLIISKVIHKASHLHLHLLKAFVKQLDKLMFKVIWDSKCKKISKLNESFAVISKTEGIE